MRLQFDEYFQKYTNGLAEIEVKAATVGEAVTKAFERFPQLYVHLVDEDGKVARASLFRMDGVPIWEMEDCERTVTPETILQLSFEVPAGEGSVWKYVTGAVLLIVGVILLFTPLAAFGPALITSGLTTILTTVVVDTFFTPESPDFSGANGINNSPTYTFSGIRNTTASGTPINIVYGTHRVGGHVLNMYTTYATNKDATSEFLMVQLGLCEGEVASISEIEVNRSPLSYYLEIETWTDRVGVGTQDALPGFDRTESTTTIGRLITNPSAKITVPKAAQDTPAPVYGYVDTDRNTIVEGKYVVELTDWYRVEEGGGG